MNLQYQLSNGEWVNCNDRTEEFLTRCAENNGPDASGRLVPRNRAARDATSTEVLTALEAGQRLRNHPEDWYSECRAEPEQQPARAPEMVKCDCGHECEKVVAMYASRGTSCPECYDRMSN